MVVKVRRPGIVDQIELDLELLRTTAQIAEKRSDTARLLQLNALTEELEQHLLAELDFSEEAHNAELISTVIADYADDLFVPQPIQPYVTAEVLVLEQVVGEKVTDDHGLSEQRASELAQAFFRAYIRQITVKGIYHADPHRGNVLITRDGRLALLDFGLVGRLDDDTRTSLALLLLAIAQNRADDVADLIVSLSLTSVNLRRGRFRPRPASNAAALPMAATRSNQDRPSTRRPPTTLPPAPHRTTYDVRPCRQDALPGRNDRAHPRPHPRPRPAHR